MESRFRSAHETFFMLVQRGARAGVASLSPLAVAASVTAVSTEGTAKRGCSVVAEVALVR